MSFSASFSSSSFRVSSTLPRTNSLSCPLIISSFSCTIFSDMVYRLLSEWCVATSFYQSLQAMSSFILFSICASYCTLSCDAHSTASSHEKFRNHRPTSRNRRPSTRFQPFIRRNKKTLLGKKPSSVKLLAGEEGFEPSAYGFGDRRSTN